MPNYQSIQDLQSQYGGDYTTNADGSYTWTSGPYVGVTMKPDPATGGLLPTDQTPDGQLAVGTSPVGTPQMPWWETALMVAAPLAGAAAPFLSGLGAGGGAVADASGAAGAAGGDAGDAAFNALGLGADGATAGTIPLGLNAVTGGTTVAGGASPSLLQSLGLGANIGGSLLNGLFNAKAQAAQLKQQQAQTGLQATQLNPYAQQQDAARLALANGLAQNATPASYSNGKLTGGAASWLSNPSTFAGMEQFTSPSAMQGGYDAFQNASQIAQGNPAPTGPGTIPGMSGPVNPQAPGAPSSWQQYLAQMMAGGTAPIPSGGG